PLFSSGAASGAFLPPAVTETLPPATETLIEPGMRVDHDERALASSATIGAAVRRAARISRARAGDAFLSARENFLKERASMLTAFTPTPLLLGQPEAVLVYGPHQVLGLLVREVSPLPRSDVQDVGE